MIVCDERNPRAVSLRDAVREVFPSGWGGDERVLVFGGDGFLLHTVHRFGYDRVYLGLNAGLLGFLLNGTTDMPRVLRDLEAEAFDVHRFPLLEARVELRDGSVRRALAMNDIYLERSTGQTARLAVIIDGHQTASQLVADGLIFFTALGSTAYSFSAGGMPLHPKISVLGITPICPHRPKLSPMALPPSSTARVEVEVPERRPVRVVADGVDIEDVSAVDVKVSSTSVQLAYFHGRDFTEQMVKKVGYP